MTAYEHDGFLLVTEADYGVAYQAGQGWVRPTFATVKGVCAICGAPINQEKRNGRPPATCDGPCRVAYYQEHGWRLPNRHAS